MKMLGSSADSFKFKSLGYQRHTTMDGQSSLPEILFGIELTGPEENLFREIIIAHKRAATENQNVSAMAFACACKGGAGVAHSIACALSSTGYVHAPIEQARFTLFDGPELINVLRRVDAGEVIPGFGNDFHKDKIDPCFQKAFDLLDLEHQDVLNSVSKRISDRHLSPVFPNAASITAAVANQLKLPAGAETLIFLIGRSAGWITIF